MGVQRRTFLRIAGCACLAGAGYAALLEPRWLEVTEHDVPVVGLPRALEGFTIAQLSDIHIGRFGGLHARLVEELAARSPQLVALTGDVLDDPAALPAVKELVHALAAPGRQLVATLGNWEHWAEVPLDELGRVYRDAGVRLLGNESTALADGVVLVATDDGCSGHADELRAFRDVPTGAARLLLTHAPGLLDELGAGTPRYDLALAGHTHGGQLRAFGAAVWTPPGSGRFRHGHYQTAQGRAYVSRGIGASVIGARFTCRPELPFFRLVAA
jgi:hypothetical protein